MERDPSLVKIIAALLILTAVFSVIEWLFTANRGQPRWQPDIKTDICYWFFTPLLSGPLTKLCVGLTLVLVLQARPENLKAIIYTRETWATRLPDGLEALLLVFIGDFIGYWTHRWFHSKRLWKFHAVHHSSRMLDWLSSVRVHPVNEIIPRCISVGTLVILGFSPLAVAAYVPFLTFYALMLHANVNWTFGLLGKYIASPVFHRWHHTSQEEGLDKNFAGLFSFIDRMFGTYYMPEGKLPEKFGLYNENIPDTLWGQLAYPFKRTTMRDTQ